MADRVLGGRYTVQDKVGIGGMATVYRGLDNVLGRTVAIKMMLPQYAADPSFAARFKQEAQAAAALQSPYIVGVYDWGKDGDTFYIIMEYLRGTDLKSGIRKHGALDCRKVAQIGSQICQALSVAHKHDIIHRDIKPQNIMVQPDGNIKVMDFGIARAKNSHLTQDNSVLGTAHYVSPEQAQGKELGPTSDLYSLGIVMYEAATGKVPFDGDDAVSVALKQINEQPVPPSQVNPAVDATLEGIILKCMQKDPAARFQTADELRRVLNDYLAGRIVNLGEATTLIAGTPTTQLNRNGATQTMAAAGGATKPIAATGRISTQQGNAARAAQQKAADEAAQAEAKHRRRVRATVVAIIAVIAVAAAVVFALTSNSGTQAVPNLDGMTEAEARAEIAKTNGFFEVGDITQEYSDTVDSGKLIRQSPARGTQQNKGTKIDLVFSQGKQPAAKVTVPDLSNLTLDEANAKLTSMGLVPVNGSPVASEDVENGRVVKQDTASGTEVDEGTSVTFHLSSGAGQADAGDHSGESASSAQSALEDAGFDVQVTYAYSSSVSKGVVISQSPTGTQTKGNTVTLTVSQGPDPAAATTSATTTRPTTTSRPSNGGSSDSDDEGDDTGDSGSATTGSANPKPSTGTGTGSGSEDLAPGN